MFPEFLRKILQRRNCWSRNFLYWAHLHGEKLIPSVPPFDLDTTTPRGVAVSAYGDIHWLYLKQRAQICCIVSFGFKKEDLFSSPHPG